MNVARLNLSHGTHSTHAQYIRTVRRLSQRLGIKVAILMDLPGPKYRTGRLKDGQAILRNGAMLTLTTEDVEGDATLVPVNLPTLPQDVKVGDEVLLDDGAMQLRVLEKKVPGMLTSGPFITEALREHILFAIKEAPEYIAISFVSSAGDVSGVKEVLRQNGSDIPIIAKIEKVQAVKDFVDI
jgi:pyruvate kinase